MNKIYHTHIHTHTHTHIYIYIKFSMCIDIHYILIQLFGTNIPIHVADKGYSGMPCMHAVSRYLLHMTLDLFYSQYHIVSLYITIVIVYYYNCVPVRVISL